MEGKRLKYIGAGAYLDRDIVATVAHKMLAYECKLDMRHSPLISH